MQAVKRMLQQNSSIFNWGCRQSLVNHYNVFVDNVTFSLNGAIGAESVTQRHVWLSLLDGGNSREPCCTHLGRSLLLSMALFED